MNFFTKPFFISSLHLFIIICDFMTIMILPGYNKIDKFAIILENFKKHKIILVLFKPLQNLRAVSFKDIAKNIILL